MDSLESHFDRTSSIQKAEDAVSQVHVQLWLTAAKALMTLYVPNSILSLFII